MKEGDNIEINKPIRLIELFSGIGFQRMALRDIGADFESWKTCEWDVNAIRQYKAIHCNNDKTDYSENKSKEDLVQFFTSNNISITGRTPLTEEKLNRKSEKWLRNIYNECCTIENLIDIRSIKGKDLNIIDKENYCYIMTYSFPCIDLSVAGKMNGMQEGSGSYSSLLWEVKRILTELDNLPQILIMENVIQIHSKNNINQFKMWQSFLNELGYINYWQDMNAKDYGIPQSRNRTFMISVLDENDYIFPCPIILKTEFKDYLEKSIEEKYYINSPKAEELKNLLLDKYKLSCFKEINTIDLSINNPEFIKIANCITAHLAKDGIQISNRKGINNGVIEVNNINKCRIRKITPREAYRLMGVNDDDFNKANKVVANTLLYKAAGNGIVKNCLEAIFCSMNIKGVPTWEEYSKKYNSGNLPFLTSNSL